MESRDLRSIVQNIAQDIISTTGETTLDEILTVMTSQDQLLKAILTELKSINAGLRENHHENQRGS